MPCTSQRAGTSKFTGPWMVAIAIGPAATVFAETIAACGRASIMRLSQLRVAAFVCAYNDGVTMIASTKRTAAERLMRMCSPAKRTSPDPTGGCADETAHIMRCVRLADSSKVLVVSNARRCSSGICRLSESHDRFLRSTHGVDETRNIPGQGFVASRHDGHCVQKRCRGERHNYERSRRRSGTARDEADAKPHFDGTLQAVNPRHADFRRGLS